MSGAQDRGRSVGSPRRKGCRSPAAARGRGRSRRDVRARYATDAGPAGADARAPRSGVSTDAASRGRTMDRPDDGHAARAGPRRVTGIVKHRDGRPRMANPHRRKHTFVRQHSLSIASAGILVLWICLYSVSSPRTHIGSFFGNAIADWSGVVVMVFATKYLYERGTAERRCPPRSLLGPVLHRLRDPSFSLFLVLPGLVLIALYVSMDSESHWGQVVGNIVSEWTQ